MSLPDFLTVDAAVCDIYRLTVDVDHLLGASPGAYVLVSANVVCALDRSMSINRQYGGGREVSLQGATNQETFKMFLLPTADIISGDKVIIGTTEYKVDNVIPLKTQKEAMLSLWV